MWLPEDEKVKRGYMTLQDYLSLFTGASREKARFMALAEAVLRQAMDLQAVVAAMPAAFSVEEAAGIQLYALAEVLGLRRSDLGENVQDGALRQYVLSKLALWRWDGSNGTAQAVLSESLPGRREMDNQDGTVSVSPAGRKDLVPAPAGVRVVFS